MVHLARNLAQVRERIERAVERSGHDREVTLIVVTKYVSADVVNELLELGVQHVGESRVQDAERKFTQIKKPCQKHLIGTLQRNKVGKALELFDLIHSVDRIPLVETISRRAGDRTVDVLLQVNVSGETTKHGVKPEKLPALAEAASQAGNIRVRGLMTMAPYTENSEETRPFFARLRELADELGRLGLPRVSPEILSMGMSNDFEVAVEEGATHVRVGSAIFQ